MNPEEELRKLGITLPEPSKPLAAYVAAVRTGNYLFISGQLPIVDGNLLYKGKIPVDVSVDDGYKAAETIAINIIAIIKGELGSLDKVKRVVRINGLVQSADDFTQHPAVINGASELFVKVFGDKGKHSRVAMGVNSLPMNTAVEIDAIIEVED